MNNQEINIAMAELEGYRNIVKNFNQSGETKGQMSDGEYVSTFYRTIPNYLNDRNATWRVLEKLTKEELTSLGKRLTLPNVYKPEPDTDVREWIALAFGLILVIPLNFLIRAILEVKRKWVE
jgi:hypothetical protein